MSRSRESSGANPHAARKKFGIEDPQKLALRSNSEYSERVKVIAKRLIFLNVCRKSVRLFGAFQAKNARQGPPPFP
jgi:endo-1,4-beta-mannosidase